VEDVRAQDPWAQLSLAFGSTKTPKKSATYTGINLRVLDQLGDEVAHIAMKDLEDRGDIEQAQHLKRLFERAHYAAGGGKTLDELLSALQRVKSS
jgi:hypothetical protein